LPVELGKRLEDEFEENEDDTCEVLFTGGRQEDAFGVFLQATEDDTCDVFTGGRKMRGTWTRGSRCPCWAWPGSLAEQ
jgi:hypothetical protein